MNYCTLFNSSYLSRGLALYRSLLHHTKHFHLYIFAFDDTVYTLLNKMQLKHVTVISLQEFETEALRAIKLQRTIGEYCWTCTPATILHCLEKYDLSEVCYLDADLFFFADPAHLLAEVLDDSVLITLHRYTPQYDNSVWSGKYCVQFMYFRNDENGLETLLWWRDACLEWCFDRVEEGKFGDQKYLDDWCTRFQGIKVLEHLGGGVAPWNVQQYDILSSQPVLLQERATKKSFSLIFYHFHALKFINHSCDLGSYTLSQTIINTIYLPYIAALLEEEKNIHQYVKEPINVHGKTLQPNNVSKLLKNIKRKLYGIYNVLKLKEVTHGSYN